MVGNENKRWVEYELVKKTGLDSPRASRLTKATNNVAGRAAQPPTGLKDDDGDA